MKNSQIFCGGFFLAEILTDHATVSELPNSSVSKACQALSINVTNFNKTTICSRRHHLGNGVRGVPSHHRSMPEQFHHLPGPLLPR